MTNPPKLTVLQIQNWVGEPSFSRGMHYYIEGRIHNARLQGMILKADCSGSRPEPYRVEVVLGSKGILSANCTCPVGEGGYCKHTAALLLSWFHESESFQDIELLVDRLENRSKRELINLIQRMIDRYPDLELLLAIPDATNLDTINPIDTEMIKHQLELTFALAKDEWKNLYRLIQDLDDVLAIGKEYTQVNHWRNAKIVYETLARSVLDNYKWLYDEGGQLSHVVFQCCEGLVQCLENADDATQRERLLRTLFDVYNWDMEAGGYGFSDEIPENILALANEKEKQKVVEWLYQALPGSDSWVSEFHSRELGGFLLELQKSELDDESYIQICRETGRQHDLIDRLLSLNRIDEALVAAKSAEDYELLQLADLFVLHDKVVYVEELIATRIKTSKYVDLTTWLKESAEKHGDLVKALKYARIAFWKQPSTTFYTEMRKLAHKLHQWETIRVECLKRLWEEKNFRMLVEIHLLEGDIDLALEMLKLHQNSYRWGGSTLALEVARVAEKSRPYESIRLYIEEVEHLIARRGRGNYSAAVDYLLTIRRIYKQIDDEKSWITFITDLREKNRRLPAMQDEFDKAGL